MKDKPANVHASVIARLRRVARAKNSDYQLILRRYAIERLLHRLSVTPQRHQFILKGAMLFTAWLEDPFRPTHDLDLLGQGDPTSSSIEAAFRAICQVEIDDDGLAFDADGLRIETIREDQQYGGVRVKTVAFLGKPRIPVQVDIGFGDAITPAAEELEFPPLLAPRRPPAESVSQGNRRRRKASGDRIAWASEQPNERFLRPACAVAPLRVRGPNPRLGHPRDIRASRHGCSHVNARRSW